jgi:hypothetical protein
MVAMGLKERVERVLREQDTYDLQPAGGENDLDNCYIVEELRHSVRVRGGRVSTTHWTNDPATVTTNNWTLNNCMDVLLDAGFLVELIPEQAGGHLIVREA